MNKLDTRAKIKTKVFAGGAVIAEQITNGGTDQKVMLIHADPVTGSKQEVIKSGAAINNPPKAREEYEPLGQSVRPTAPIVLDPPGGSPSPIINNSSDFADGRRRDFSEKLVC